MKVVTYFNKNTCKLPFEHSTLRRFNILPKCELYYDSMGFFTWGGEGDEEYCKELIISFGFLILSFEINFYWDFYKYLKT